MLATTPASTQSLLAIRDDRPERIVLSVTVESLDVRSADQWYQQVEPYATRDHVVLDFAKVRVLDSAGLGSIVAAVRAVRDAGGELSIVSLCADVRVLFELVRLHQLVDVYNDLDELERVMAE